MASQDSHDLAQIVEALIFASPDPITTAGLVRAIRTAASVPRKPRGDEEGSQPDEGADSAEVVAEDSHEGEPFGPAFDASSITEAEVAAAIGQLVTHYTESGRSFTLEERASGWRLFTRPEFGGWVRGLFPERKPQRLSQPALETLAIIAYRQPITKAAIEAVRGVSIDGPLQRLLDMNIVRISGRADLPGRPLLYETTGLFFDHFGIKSVDDLPNAAELRRVTLPAPEEEKPREARIEQAEMQLDAPNSAPSSSAPARAETAPPPPLD
ncbi:MAG: SMC-Scp complex subunit ScpB [Verrucomicrobiales bacterium]